MTAACVLLAGISWNIGSAGAAAESLRDAYAISLPAVGLLTTVMFAVQVAGTLPAGRLIDRFGPEPLALIALICVGLGNAVLLVAPAIALALIGRAIVGAGFAFGFLAGARMVQRAGGGTLAQGFYGGVGLGGAGVGIALIPVLAAELGWRAPWLGGLVTVVPGLVALVLLRRVGSSGSMPGSGSDGATSPVPLGELVRDLRLQRLAAVQAMSFGFAVVLANWTVPLLERAGTASAVAGTVGGLVLFLGILSRPGGGVLARHLGPRASDMLELSLLGCAAGAAMLAAAPQMLPVAAAGALVAGLAAGLPFGPVLAAAADVRPEAAGTAVALVNIAALVVIVLATPLLGLSFQLPGDGRLGIAALALAAVAAAITGARLRAAARQSG